MAEEHTPKFTTKRRSIGSDGELKWGGEDGETWDEAVESSQNITVNDDGTVSSGNDIPQSGEYLDFSEFNPEPPHTFSIDDFDGTYESDLVDTSYSEMDALEHYQNGSIDSDTGTGKYFGSAQVVDITDASKLHCATWMDDDGPYDRFLISLMDEDDRPEDVTDDERLIRTSDGHDWTERSFDVDEYEGQWKLFIGQDPSKFRYRSVTTRVTNIYFE